MSKGNVKTVTLNEYDMVDTRSYADSRYCEHDKLIVDYDLVKENNRSAINMGKDVGRMNQLEIEQKMGLALMGLGVGYALYGIYEERITETRNKAVNFVKEKWNKIKK
jgi:hypothetical protein